jgi:hypothetical protein
MVADGDCFPPPLQKTEGIDPEIESAVAGIREILEREIDFLQRQIKARGLGMNANDLAGLEVAIRPVLLDAVEAAAGLG